MASDSDGAGGGVGRGVRDTFDDGGEETRETDLTYEQL